MTDNSETALFKFHDFTIKSDDGHELVLTKQHDILLTRDFIHTQATWSGTQCLVLTASEDFPGGYVVEVFHADLNGVRLEDTINAGFMLGENDFEFEQGTVRFEGDFEKLEAFEQGLTLLKEQGNIAAPYLDQAHALQLVIGKLDLAGFHPTSGFYQRSPEDYPLPEYERVVPGFEGQELVQVIQVSESYSEEPDAWKTCRVEFFHKGEAVESDDNCEVVQGKGLANALSSGLEAAEFLMRFRDSLLETLGLANPLQHSTAEPSAHRYGFTDEQERVYYYDTPDERTAAFDGIVLQDSIDGLEQSYSYFVIDGKNQTFEDEAVQGPTSHYAKSLAMANMLEKGWTALGDPNSPHGEFALKAPSGEGVGLVIHTGNEQYSAILVGQLVSPGLENLTIGRAMSHLEQSFEKVRSLPLLQVGEQPPAKSAAGKNRGDNGR